MDVKVSINFDWLVVNQKKKTLNASGILFKEKMEMKLSLDTTISKYIWEPKLNKKEEKGQTLWICQMQFLPGTELMDLQQFTTRLMSLMCEP